MKEELLKKLVNESQDDINTYYDELGDYSYKALDEKVLVRLLNIKNKIIRFKALETITCPGIDKNIALFILSFFESVNTELGAFTISWVALDENLRNNSLYKYFLLLNKIVEFRDEKIISFTNIFTNINIVNLTNQEYFEYINECISKSSSELESIENSLYEKKLKR